MPETPDPIDEHEQAWSNLFKSLRIIREESQKPGFPKLAFKDGDGRVWGVSALMRHAERQLNFPRKALGHAER